MMGGEGDPVSSAPYQSCLQLPVPKHTSDLGPSNSVTEGESLCCYYSTIMGTESAHDTFTQEE